MILADLVRGAVLVPIALLALVLAGFVAMTATRPRSEPSCPHWSARNGSSRQTASSAG